MWWIGDLVARWSGKGSTPHSDLPSAIPTSERDLFVELIAASSYLDFGGAPLEARLRENESGFDRDVRPS